MAPHSATHCLVATLFTFTQLSLHADASSFLRAGKVTKDDAVKAFEAELAGEAGQKRLRELEESLRTSYRSLPKNPSGNLGHQAVRYVLHRYFVQRNGWYVRGLEPNNRTWHDEKNPHAVKEWVPDYLQGLLEQRLGERGTNLHELAVLAAALEDLVRKEATGRLGTAYEIHHLSGSINELQVGEVMMTYFMSYLLAGNLSASSTTEMNRKKKIFAEKYSGYTEAKEWLDKVVDKHIRPASGKAFDFERVTEIVTAVGEEFHSLNDLECKSLKQTLLEMEGKKAGRVRLSVFYKTGLHSHWRFNEKADYLRVLGALDESQADQPRVIVPNYLISRTNCLEASDLYAVCCRNECEELMGQLERQIGSEAASPTRIEELVSAMPSATVQAPRSLPTLLTDRLKQVAAVHGGQVPLHGRLFAQWMHHAFPRECPYPHEAGKTVPQTPDEWMEETGQKESHASKEQMMEQIDADTCASDSPHGPGCGEDEDPALPWTEAEELLLQHPAGADAPPRFRIVLLAAFLAVIVIGSMVVDYRRVMRRIRHDKSASTTWLAAGGFSLLALAAFALDLLDGTMLALAFCVGLVAVAAKQSGGLNLVPDGAGPKKAKLPL